MTVETSNRWWWLDMDKQSVPDSCSCNRKRAVCCQQLISCHYSSCCCSCWDHALQKCLRLRHFKSDRDVIWQDCSSSKYASIDRVKAPIWSTISRWRPWRHLDIVSNRYIFTWALDRDAILMYYAVYYVGHITVLCRASFTWWVTIVQLICFIVTMAVYGAVLWSYNSYYEQRTMSYWCTILCTM